MHLKRTHIAEPLPEKYTRVTNPARFRPLQDFALELISQLRDEYDVVDSETFEIIPGIMKRVEYARPPVTLTPVLTDAAPISIAFTSFPSLIVRCGRFYNAPFPACACDACEATADNEAERLKGVVANVVSGQFREQIELPFFGAAQVTWCLGTADPPYGLSRGGHAMSRGSARALRSAGFKHFQWVPWPRR